MILLVDENDFNNRNDRSEVNASVLFDDAGTPLPADPVVDGATYAPNENLARLIGESAIGMWSFYFSDNSSGDPLGVFGVTLHLEVTEINGTIPESGTLALLSLGLVGLGILRRRRGEEGV